jgi:hypothetical protein
MGAGGMPKQKEETKENLKPVTVRFHPLDVQHYDHKATDEGMQRGPFIRFLAWVSDSFYKYVRPVFTKEYLFGEYDKPDVTTLLHGGEPDLDWIKQDVLRMSKDVSLSEYKRRLGEEEAECEVAKKTLPRLIDYRLDVIHEEQDRVEHLLEKE